MTLEELAAKMDAGFAAVHKKMDDGFAAVEKRFTSVDERFAAVDERFATFGRTMDQRFATFGQTMDQRSAAVGQTMDSRFAAFEKKMDEGFKDSKIRDEELRGLMKFGLEANEILREDMNRRFDAADQKNDEQIGLLKDTVRHLSSHK